MQARLFSVLSIAAGLACASPAPRGGVQRDSTVITADEVGATHESNAYDVIQLLRPNFLRSRGRTSINTAASEYPSVFVDGQFYGDLGTLRSIIAPMIKEIRFYNGPDAVTRFGMLYGSGVIAVSTR